MNIDAFDATVANQIMSAYYLMFEDNVASLIECTQVLEHLGAAKSLYALAECFRVLRPGGALLLKTPDIEEAFKMFLRKGKAQRAYLMNWIYGLDTPGMAHRFAFTEDLLTQMLQQTGFVQIQTTRQGKGSIQPSIRATCQKPHEYKPYQLMSWVRRTLQEKGVVNLDNQVEALDQEPLLRDLGSYALNLAQGFDEEILNRKIVETTIYSPQIALAFLNEAIQARFLLASQVTDQLHILDRLVELNFPAILLYLLTQLPTDEGTQQQAVRTIQRIGMKTVDKLLKGKQRSTVLKELRETRKGITKVYDITYFSDTVIQQLAAKQFALATKAFAEQQLSKAEALFMEGLRLDRDNLLATWNLARLLSAQGNLVLAKEYYVKTRYLGQRYKLPDRRRITKRLQQEIKQLSDGRPPELATPLFHPL